MAIVKIFGHKQAFLEPHELFCERAQFIHPYIKIFQTVKISRQYCKSQGGDKYMILSMIPRVAHFIAILRPLKQAGNWSFPKIVLEAKN